MNNRASKLHIVETAGILAEPVSMTLILRSQAGKSAMWLRRVHRI